MPGCKVTALLQKGIKHLFEDVGITVGVRIGQCAPGNTVQPEMIPLPMVTPEADFDITQTGQSFCLREQ
jgi:hypothetical protein